MTLPKSKADIVQRLLDKKQITAEEAVTLLTNDTVQEHYNPYKTYPWFHTEYPFRTICSTNNITNSDEKL
jgi:hypothetical protein